MAGTPVLAAENDDAKNYISEFVQEISKDEDYSIWTESTPIFGYELYGADFENIVGDLYYMNSNGENVGYVIINREGNTILEFSVGTPAYDNMSETLKQTKQNEYM